MKKHSISIILALIICLSSLFVSARAALTIGDIDGKGGVTAGDARLALRAAVGLEKLNEQQKKAADVNFDNKITADDARSILRASVGLETLHAHSYTSEVTKAATCTEKGIRTYKCSCSDSYTEEIPKTAHNYTARTETLKEASCVAEGQLKKYCKCGASMTEAVPKTVHIFEMEVTKQPSAGSTGTAEFSCSVCSHKESIVLCTHTAKSISVDKVTNCSTAGCKGQIPSFNHLVNSLKATGSRNYFSGFTKSTTVTQKAKATEKNILYWGLAQMLQGMLNSGIEEGTEVEYFSFINNRHVNKNTFSATNKSFVSSLKESDIKSIAITKMNGVDFVKNLPSSYKVTSSGSTVDLSKIKASQIGNVYKVSVVLPSEKVSSSNLTANSSPIERIYDSNYYTDLRKTLNQMNTEFASLPEEFKNFLSADTTATTNFTVDYYFKADTFDPVCAAYNIAMETSVDMNLYINDDGEKQKDPTVAISIKASNTQQNYYFFNSHFTIK